MNRRSWSFHGIAAATRLMSATPGEGEGMNGLLAGTASVILRRQGADLFLRVYRSLVGVCDRYGEVRVEHSARYHSLIL